MELMDGSGVLFWRNAATRQGQLTKAKEMIGEWIYDLQDGGGKFDCPCCGVAAALQITG